MAKKKAVKKVRQHDEAHRGRKAMRLRSGGSNAKNDVAKADKPGRQDEAQEGVTDGKAD